LSERKLSCAFFAGGEQIMEEVNVIPPSDKFHVLEKLALMIT
jgi:hypothetical protein